MNRKYLISLVFSLTLITSLFGGTVASGAQTAPVLTETYTWQPYGLSVNYPADWTVTPKSKATSIHPADHDVSDGLGPELILFLVSNPHPAGAGGSFSAALTQIIDDFAQQSGGQVGTVTPGIIDRYLSQSADLTWSGQSAVGGLRVIGIDPETVLGVAYIVRQSEAGEFQSTLHAIFDTATFGTPRVEFTGQSSSISTASVQLPQRHTWDDTGLVMYFPSAWEIKTEPAASRLDNVIAMPPTSASDTEASFLIEATGVTGMTNLNLHNMAEMIANGYGGATTDIVDVTVAGYPGVVYDVLDQRQSPVYHVRTVLVDVSDRKIVVPIVLGAEESAWNAFDPIASAFISSIERLNQPVSQLPSGILLTAAHPAPAPDGLPFGVRRQGTGDTQPFAWEEYGVTFTLPATWTTSQGGQNYDLALVSPEAASTGTGTFILLTIVPSLGPGETIETALKPLADQVKGTVKPFTLVGLDGVTIDFIDDTTKTIHHLMLIPYGAQGEYLYIQTLATSAAEDQTVMDVMNSIVINPPDADHAKVDAAWQASLAAEGKLLYGDPNAPVHMVEFLDFSCSHCASYSFKIEHLIPLEADSGHVNLEFVLLDTIGGELSNNAAQATYCAAEQGKGYSAYKALFLAEMSEGRDTAYVREGIDRLLGDSKVGVDVTALNACLDAGKYKGLVDAARTRANDVGVTGTPSVLLGKGSDTPAFLTLPDGTQWSGEIPLHVLRLIFKAAIENDTPLQDAANTYFNGG